MNGDTGPCTPWDITWCCPISGVSPVVTGMAADAATEVLWALSGRQFGFCDIDFRPCRTGCTSGPLYGAGWWWDDDSWIHPELLDGNWINIACGLCLGDCSCSHVEEVILPGDAYSIVSVTIDGEVLPTGGAYRLDDHRKLVRTDGGSWPLCQNWGVSSGPGSWFVRTRFGHPVPSIGLMAVSELASEFIKACQPGMECALPRRVQEIVRNGLTITFDDMSFLKDGDTGMYLADLFIAAYNPNKLTGRSRVYSPDRPSGRFPG